MVGETVALKRAGTAYKGLCPFHAEKTPSFIVTPRARVAGTASAAARAATSSPSSCGATASTSARPRRAWPSRPASSSPRGRPGRIGVASALREALEAAIAWYREVLLQTQPGRAGPRLPGGARPHAARRWSASASATRRTRWEALTTPAASRSGFSDERAHRCRARQSVEPRRRVSTGSVAGSSSRSATRSGRAVGLGGRIMPGAGGTEVPELAGDGPLFDKSRTLYAIDLAKARDPPGEADGHRGGLHRCDGRPPGRLRERGGQPRDRADARARSSWRESLRRCGRPCLRRRPRGRGGDAARPARGARAASSTRCA